MIHSVSMSSDFVHWLNGLKDKTLYFDVVAWLTKMKNGELGQITEVGDDIYETSIPSYPNLRFYLSKIYTSGGNTSAGSRRTKLKA